MFFVAHSLLFGTRSLCIHVPPGLGGGGGAYVDASINEGWLYVVKARVFHEEDSPSYEGDEDLGVTTRIMLWDTGDVKEASAPTIKRGE